MPSRKRQDRRRRVHFSGDAVMRIELVSVENRIVEFVRAQTFADHFNKVAHVVRHHDLHGFREYRPGDDEVCLKILFLHPVTIS